ncbi:MAG: lysophospholipid acyltransferase family protein [Bdellovibrionales bacterium]
MKSLTGICLKFFSYFMHSLPRSLQLLAGDLLAYFAFDILRFRRKITMDNVQLAFPKLSLKEQTQIARGSYKILGRSLIEYSHFPFMNMAWIEKNCELHGREKIQRAIDQKKGVLVLGLHLGNGDLALASLAVQGYPINLISKHFKSEWLNEIWFGVRKKIGMKFTPEEKSSYQILRGLKNKDCVVFVLDQFMGPPAGVSTIFFGKETGTAAGLALFSLRSGAPVVPAYTFRVESGKTMMIFEDPIEPIKTDNHEADVSKMTQIYTSKLEEIIKKYPDQWMWLHRRWKTFEVR